MVMNESPQRGMVYLVGAGPGDPELVTLKGLHCLRMADVVLYDRLVSPALLAEARPGAELVFVGKEANCHTMTQAEINTRLIAYAQQNCFVVRLKGVILSFLDAAEKRHWHWHTLAYPSRSCPG
ncbi:MAG: hypothetical protein NVS4B11_32540 [Ktedonobacteraceae bacterium]